MGECRHFIHESISVFCSESNSTVAICSKEFPTKVTRGNCGINVYGNYECGGSASKAMTVSAWICLSFVLPTSNDLVTL